MGTHDSNYIQSCLSSFIGQRQIDRINAGGSRQGLNFQQVRSLMVPWPEEREREALVESLGFISERRASESSSLSKLKSQKAALMDDLLKGRVRVKV